MKNTENSRLLPDVLKGSLVAVITLTFSILIFAGLITVSGLSDSVIKSVNQFIKVISLFCGCFFTFSSQKGYLKGLLTGILFTLISYLLFSMVGGKLSFGTSFIIDLIFLSVVGTVLGVLTVSIKK